MTAFGAVLFLLGPASGFSFEIEGVVQMAPPWPESKVFKVREDYREHCGLEQVSERLIISAEGFLKNAVVSLKGKYPLTLPSPPVGERGRVRGRKIPVLDQKNCNFDPHILVVPAGDVFEVANADPMAHDIRFFEGYTMKTRFEMDAYDKPVERVLEDPETYVVRCGLHPWMHAYIVAAPHEFFAVTDESGRFRLENVPAGTHHLKIWHEKLGETEVEIVIAESVGDFSYTFEKS